MKINFDPQTHREILDQIVSYLDPFTDVEQGGYLIGTRKKIDGEITVTINKFHPLLNNYESWPITENQRAISELPAKEIGYFPDPNEAFKLMQELFPTKEDAEEMIVGHVHSHMMGIPNPSHYDLMLNKERMHGYLMPIYSSGTKTLKIWIVRKDSEWESKTSNSLAQVVLAAIWPNN